jgi:hypothetical protein
MDKKGGVFAYLFWVGIGIAIGVYVGKTMFCG